MSEDPFDQFISIEADVRRLMNRAAIETDEPDQVVRAMLMLTAATIVRLARAEHLDISEAAQVASAAAAQLPRLVVQMGSREKTSRGGQGETPV